MTKINFLALGGLDEKNKSLNLLEIDSKIFILDAGIYEPLKNNFGIQSFIPKLDYLIENRDKVKGIFLSTAVYHQLGALINVIKVIPNLKIYGSKITLDSLKLFFPKNDFSRNFVYLNSGSEIEVSNIKISVIELNSSLPGTFGYVFKTNVGNIFYFTNYAFDSLDEYKISLLTDISQFIGKNNLLFISDSLNMEIESSVSPKYKVEKYIKKHFYIEKRIISFIYEEDFINIIELINLAKKFGRKIYIYDDKIIDLLNIVFEEKIIEKYDKIFSMSSLKEENFADALIIVTGNKTNLYKKVQSIIAEGNNKNFDFNQNDIILFAAEPIAGNEHVFQDITNSISRYNCELIVPPYGEKYTIHPSRFDLKNYLNIIKPKYFIPIMGYYKDLIQAKNLAVQSGFLEENIIIADNGELLEFENDTFKKEENRRKIKNVGSQVIESVNDSEVHSEIIDERKLLGKDGIVTIAFIIDKDKKEICSNIDIQMRGVIFIKNQEHLLDNVNEIIKKTIESNKTTEGNKGNWNVQKISSIINKDVTKLLRAGIKKTPIIIIKIKENEK